MAKSIDTLVSDIYNLFKSSEGSHTIDEDNLKELGDNIVGAVRTSLEAATKKREPYLRMSVIGKPQRQLWYELRKNEGKVEAGPEVDIFEATPEKYLMFLFGDLVEHLLVFLIKESGHTITHMQEELEVDGVKGHTDGVVDGLPADIKTASGFAFRGKFKNRALLKRGNEHDPFGYKGQLSGYREALLKKYPEEIDPDSVAWIVFNKENGEILTLKADRMELENPKKQIKELKEMLEKDKPPEKKCYPEVNHGKSGNKILHKSCSYCPFKEECWKAANGGRGLRKFKYADGTKYFTDVLSLPKVEEIDAE